MRANVKFSPSVDGLESREAPSSFSASFVRVGHTPHPFPTTPGTFVPLGSTGTTSFTPNFIRVGQPPHTLPTGPGFFVPLTTTVTHGSPTVFHTGTPIPTGTLFIDPVTGTPVGTTFHVTR